MSDFDDWVKKQGQTTTPKTAAPKPTGGSFDSWVRGETKPQPQPARPATVLPTERQEFGSRPATLDESLTQSARVNRRPQRSISTASGVPVLDAAHQEQYERDAAAHFQKRDRETFEKKPILEQWKERAHDAGARGGMQLSRMARQTAGAGLGVARGLAAGDFTPVDLPEWREGEKGRLRYLERRKLARPSSFATETAEGLIEALPAASIAALGGIATGGSLPAAMATGGGMAAAGADWRDPGRAATQTAIGAVAPVVGGKLGQVAGSAVARSLARPAAQGIARAGGEVLGGTAGNVGGAGAEQLAFEGGLNPRELARQAVIGAALTTPGLPSPGRRRVAPQVQESPSAQPVTVAQQPEAVPVVPPRVRPVLPAVEPPTVRQPAVAIAPEPGRTTAEIPQVVTAPTQRIQYPDAPETQEMPAIRERIAAENAPTAELRPSNEAAKSYTPPEPIETPPPPQAMPRRVPPPPGRPAGRPQRPFQGQFYPDFPADRRVMVGEGRRIAAEIEAGRGEKGEFGKIAQGMFKSAGGKVLHGQDSFFHDPSVKGALGLSRDAEMAEVRVELKRELARSMGVNADEVSLTQISPDVWNRWARQKRLPTGAVGKMNAAIGRYQEGAISDIEKTVKTAAEKPQQPLVQLPKTPAGRKIQHSKFGEVTEAPEQAGVRKGQLRVMDAAGRPRIIRNPRVTGNREASFVKGPAAEPVAPMQSKAPDIMRGMKRLARTPSSPVEVSALRARFPELSKEGFDAEMARLNAEGRIALHRHDHPASLSESQRNNLVKIGNDHFIAATFTDRPGEIMGMGLGPFQRFMDRGKTPERGQQALFETPKARLSRKELSETAGSVQTVAQLGNPRFLIRNVVQHVAFGKQERAATRIAAVLDWAISKGSGKGRQVFAPRGSDLADYVRNWGKVIQAHKKGQPLPGQPNVDYATADANKLDRAANKVMTWLNEIPDAANWQTRFESSLQSIMGKSKRLRAPLDMDSVVDQAMMEANRASLRDENFVSTALLSMKKGLNKLSSPVFGSDKFGAGDFILKYAQTPGALLKRGLERSPLGLFQVAKEAATPGRFRRRNTLLALSRVAEGAATGAGLGAALAAAGVIVGPEEENKTGKAMEREEGVRGYSLNASALRRIMTGDFSAEMQSGDTLYSIDWLQPWAMNLSAGAAVYNLHKDGKMGVASGAKTTGEAVYNSLAKTLDVMGDQSVLKNLARYIDRARGETFGDQLANFIKAIGLDVPSSFVPSLARQARQVADPFERDTRAEQRGGFAGFVEEAQNRALAQLPGVSSRFPTRPSLLTGEDRKTALGEMSTGGRTLAQFSPANISTFTPRAVAREISRLNQAGQDVSVSFPSPKKDEATSNLRGRERQFAETFSRMSAEMIKDDFYKDADDEMKAAAFAGLKRYLANLGKPDAEEKTVEEIVEAAIETVEDRRDKEEEDQ